MTTQADVAAHLDLSDRQVRNHITNGVLAEYPRGEYNLDECRVAYLRHLRDLAQGKRGNENPGADLEDVIDFNRERARKMKLDGDKQEFELHRLRREWAPISLITESLAFVATGANAILQSLPMRVKSRLPDLTVKEFETIQAEVALAANAITDIRLPAEWNSVGINQSSNS